MTPRRIADDIALCLVFFTRLPLPRLEFGARTLAQAIWAAPLAGVAVAVAASVVHAAASAAGLSPEVAAALALAAAMLTTGCLHEDGLSDVADGFGGGKTREQKLDIMRDSRIGAYGAAALMLSALIRWSALVQLGNPFFVFCGLAAAHAASRALLPAFMHLVPPARQDGLAAGAGTVAADTAMTALATGAVALLALGVSGLAAAAFLLALVFYGFRALCLRQIGGQTGDTLGALQQLGEIAVLLVAAAILT
ncbi:adenosylcobinamide-GDP ribazoletransferase [Mesorhizobium sp. KR9-304]|uniref:adenosylcobinamide-GDP ribazoletransferase n=1 Tax=Mesorhizobium sp. KR9-304 TaxID=3156614 RepID=UPI0032B4B03E